jgi:hypothetical protein
VLTPESTTGVGSTDQASAEEKEPLQLNNNIDQHSGGPASVNIVRGIDKKANNSYVKGKKETPINRPSTTTPVQPEELQKFKTEEELLKELQARARDRWEKAVAPKFLTTEEKQLSLGELDKKWKNEQRNKLYERSARLDPSYFDLGELSTEEKELPVSEIKKIIRDRRQERWVQKMKDQGIPLHFCEVCQQLGTHQHRCMATKFRTGNTKHPFQKGIVLSQRSGGNVVLRETKTVDPERLQQEYDKIVAIREKIETEVERTQKLLAPHEDTMMEKTTERPPQVYGQTKKVWPPVVTTNYAATPGVLTSAEKIKNTGPSYQPPTAVFR